ncbi:MAG: hypothetical protein ABI844_10065 [Saprospiraceae bacterium]
MTDLEEIKDILKQNAQQLALISQSQKETDLKFKETDLKFKETDKRIVKAFDLFEGQWGKLIESLVEGDLIRLFQERGIDVHETSQRRKGTQNGEQFEFDIIAHNGNEIIIVEVKTTLRNKDVSKFIKKLLKAKEYLQEYKEYNIYGAVAFLRSEGESDIQSANAGLFIIKATGNSASIANSVGFKPKTY